MHDELIRAEKEMLARPELLSSLGLPKQLTKIVSQHAAACAASYGPRVMRFDFHPTDEGWKISEVNSDVPGGFIESAALGRFFLRDRSHLASPPDPAQVLAESFKQVTNAEGAIALVHATAYADDRQQMECVAQQLHERGIASHLVAPDHLTWNSEGANFAPEWCRGRVNGIIRFFPAEWLPNLSSNSGWQNYFTSASQPICNPGRTILSQSKSFPLVCARNGISLPTWNAYCPELALPREVNWRSATDWIIKPCLGRVGDGIGLPESITAKDWKKIQRSARWNPRHWIAQRRFNATPIQIQSENGFPDAPSTPLERERTIYLCLGIFTVDGRPAGAYGRIARRPLIDHRAQDVPILIQSDPQKADKTP